MATSSERRKAPANRRPHKPSLETMWRGRAYLIQLTSARKEMRLRNSSTAHPTARADYCGIYVAGQRGPDLPVQSNRSAMEDSPRIFIRLVGKPAQRGTGWHEQP